MRRTSLHVSPLARDHQRLGHIHVGARRDERRDHVHVAFGCGDVERCERAPLTYHLRSTSRSVKVTVQVRRSVIFHMAIDLAHARVAERRRSKVHVAAPAVRGLTGGRLRRGAVDVGSWAATFQ